MGMRSKIEAIERLVIDTEEILWIVREQMKIYESGVKLDGYSELGFTIGLLMDKYSDDTTRAYCISERISCLTGVLRDERIRAFTNEELDPSRLGVRHEVFEAAAVCPIHCDEKNAWFDTEEFIALVLRLTSDMGRA